MRKNLLYLFTAAFILSGCSYALDTSTQEVQFVTPGATGSLCIIHVDGIRYRAYPPQKIIIPRSREDLIVDCLAPGNRRNKVVIESVYSDHAALNVLNAGVGAAWDSASGALYQYPDIIEVDFTDTPIRPVELPAQNQSDIKQPEDYPLEQFSPGQPKLNSDDNSPVEIRIRETSSPANTTYTTDAFSEAPPTGSGGKGDLQSTAPQADSAPTSIYPGQ